MKSDRLLMLALALMMTGPFTHGARAGAPPTPQPIRVVENWEDPGDITNDDNDGTIVGGVRVNDTTDLSGADSPSTAQIPRGVLDNTGLGDESPRHGRSTLAGGTRLFWGGFSAATSVTNSPSIDNTVRVLNSEGALGPGTLANSYLTFTQHSAAAGGVFPSPYNEQTGSYAYTLFSSSPSGAQSIDISNGQFKIGISHKQSLPVTAAPISFRFLIQTFDGKWYRSNPQSAPNINILAGGPFGGSASNGLTAAGREALFTTYPVSGITFERVSSAAEANMDVLGNGGEVPLGAAQSDPGPNLTAVTGMGVLASDLATGQTIGNLPNSIAVIGMILDGVATVGFSTASTNVAQPEADSIITEHIVLSQALSAPVSVDVAIGAGLATAGKDFTTSFGTLTGNAYLGKLVFAPGETEKTIDIAIVQDDIFEADEDIQVALANAQGATIPTGQGLRTIVIQNDDPIPTISIASAVNVPEAVGNALCVLTLSNRSAFPISVDFATSDQTAHAGVDYTASSGTFEVNHSGATINEDTLTASIPIPIIDNPFDNIDVATFAVTISNPANCAIASGANVEAVGIQDNDPSPTVSFTVAAQDINETNGSVLATVTLQLSAPSEIPYTVNYSTADGIATATAGVDYTAIPDTAVVFNPNPANPALSETMKSFTVEILGDMLDECPETVPIAITAASTGSVSTGLIGSPSTHTITIHDDDPPPSISIATAVDSVTEGGSIAFTVSLDKPSGRTVRVDLSFVDETAIAGQDYIVPSTTSLQFSGGQLFHNVIVQTIDNIFFDSTVRKFKFVLSNPRTDDCVGEAVTPPAIGIGEEEVTITEDEAPSQIKLDSGTQSVAEEAGSANLQVIIDPPSAQPVSVHYSAGGGTAIPNVDYKPISGIISVGGGGVGPFPISIPILDDDNPEPAKSFNVTLSSPVGATLGVPSVQVVAITDTDPPFVPRTIFSETWNFVTPQVLAAGLVVDSDESFVGLDGGSATPLANLRFANVGGSMRLQRTAFSETGSLGSTSVALGNSLRAPIDPPLDDDTVTSITLETRVFIGALTPDGTPDFPVDGAEALAPFSTFTFAIGDAAGGDLANAFPHTLWGDASLGFRLNNHRRLGGNTTSPRLEFAINDSDFGLSEELLAVPAVTHTGIGQAVDGIGMALNTVATPASTFAVGHEYLVSATFVKQSFNRTDVSYSIRPLEGSVGPGSGGVPPPLVDSGGVVNAEPIASSFPYNRFINQAAINIGSGFGAGTGGMGGQDGSWVDDLTVRTFGIKRIGPLGAHGWQLYQ